MKICMISDEHYPHTGADTVVVMNTAAALGAAGADVELITPKLWWQHKDADEVIAHYGVKPAFTLTRLPSWPPPTRKLRLEKLTHGLIAPLHARRTRCDIIHSRDLVPLLLAQSIGVPWSFETYRRHVEEKPFLPRLTRHIGLSRAIGAVAHTPSSAADLLEVGFTEEQVVVARPGIDFERFEPVLSKTGARKAIGADIHRPLVVYVGNVGPSKGTDEIGDLAVRLPHVDFLVVGGAAEAVLRLKEDLLSKNIGNVKLVGHQPPGDLAKFMYAADVLFVPAIFHNTHAGSLAGLLPFHSLPGTPLKIYGYLAAGRPIVAADQPHTRDLLTHERNALMVPPKDSGAAAAAIARLLDDEILAKRLSVAAREAAAEYTWEKRGRKMLDFFERRLSAR